MRKIQRKLSETTLTKAVEDHNSVDCEERLAEEMPESYVHQFNLIGFRCSVMFCGGVGRINPQRWIEREC